MPSYHVVKDGPIDSRFFYAVYTNGVVYYVYMFALSVANIVINMHASHNYENLLSVFQQVVHSALACRMLLQLRECGKQTVRGDEFKGCGSAFTLHVNTLVSQVAATIGEHTTYIDHTNHTHIGTATPLREEDAC